MIDTTQYGPIRGKSPGVAAIDVDGDRYCLDCAPKVLDGSKVSYRDDSGQWVKVENADGERIVNGLISGEIYTLSYGGVVLRHSTDTPDEWHCGRHRECEHAVSGDEYGYNHSEPVGVKLDV